VPKSRSQVKFTDLGQKVNKCKIDTKPAVYPYCVQCFCSS